LGSQRLIVGDDVGGLERTPAHDDGYRVSESLGEDGRSRNRANAYEEGL
jgi:hypothetical protein